VVTVPVPVFYFSWDICTDAGWLCLKCGGRDAWHEMSLKYSLNGESERDLSVRVAPKSREDTGLGLVRKVRFLL
jgi:hypothetical protein